MLDNASIHRTKVVRQQMKDRGVAIVYNVPYSPAYMGIESFWS